jgi:Kdo2-lipid IVA lauroyltransferase/acyltransferase
LCNPGRGSPYPGTLALRASGYEMKSKKKKKKKSRSLQRIEYLATLAGISLIRILPVRAVSALCTFLGMAVYTLLSKRRKIALKNLRNAFGATKSEQEIRAIARESTKSFLLTGAEIAKFDLHSVVREAVKERGYRPNHLQDLFLKAKRIHEEAGGCIFVTPHLGNWELLPFVCSMVGIPLALVARPLDNTHLEKLLFESRSFPGQVIIPKKNALFALQQVLRQGKSIGMLPDQSTQRGIAVDFFGSPATTTPVPALLSIHYRKPIVVVACCRRPDEEKFEGYVCDPIWPRTSVDERGEIIRITADMTRNMEGIIRKHPEQYLWMHNRWKTYRRKRPFLG